MDGARASGSSQTAGAYVAIAEGIDPRLPHGNAEYRFWMTALWVLVDEERLDEELPHRFRYWAEESTRERSQLPAHAWTDIFPDNPHMHSYTDAVKGMGQLLRLVRGYQVREELLRLLHYLLEERKMAAPPGAGPDRDHREAFDAWVHVRWCLKEAKGRGC